MKAKTLYLTLAVASFLGATGYGLYWAGMTHGQRMSRSPSVTAPGATEAHANGKKILYWHDPMYPQQRFDKPGKSPFMDMELVPVYADDGGDKTTVRINPVMQQNLGVRTAEVTLGTLTQVIEATGTVAYNEREVALVQVRSNGIVEKLHVHATLDTVHKGQPLAEVRLVESNGSAHARRTLVAPASGVVTEIGAREGMTVMAGATLFRINGLRTVWLHAEVPENTVAQVRPNGPVEIRIPALPDIAFNGRVNAILPEVAPATRTRKVRIEVANSEDRLVPGMFATISFVHAAKEQTLLVPSEALIRTGTRNVIIVDEGKGNFRSQNVQPGLESGERTEILSGLSVGERVVTSGQFLIDSEASLKGTTTRMDASTHRGEGKVERIDKNEVTLSHGPIPSLKWGPMTMGFRLPSTGFPKNLAVGDTVTFEIRETGDGMFEITSISAVAPAPAQSVTGENKGNPSGAKEPKK
ncbi:MAG TPA: efflux RND transporter periplasmic adaptor subunit [Burkholderiales bacterium]|nr:efflux RND transporter periplasmic adaptor subunit [Burkholderiales bacterium]